ncbi:Diaminopimelate epimerase [Rickettsiales bacterium Ac37b]|nr:Diaminopimelate epimerase [Rickettsiales bacterium Ac37b]
MSIINFIKMHGCGNDFVVIDTKSLQDAVLPIDVIKKITDRRYGVGCDQLILIEKSEDADCFMRIYNADGTEAGACGNASRCVASLLANTIHKNKITIETATNILMANIHANGLVTIDMGVPKFSVSDLKLLWDINPLSLQIKIDDMSIDAAAINVGNIHLICFYDNDINLESLVTQVNALQIFAEEVNISVINIDHDIVYGKFSIKIRTWERGAGETLSCGTAACAATVSAIKRGYILHNTSVEVHSKGGTLSIEWFRDNGSIMMTGEAIISFTGQINL